MRIFEEEKRVEVRLLGMGFAGGDGGGRCRDAGGRADLAGRCIFAFNAGRGLAVSQLRNELESLACRPPIFEPSLVLNREIAHFYVKCALLSV